MKSTVYWFIIVVCIFISCQSKTKEELADVDSAIVVSPGNELIAERQLNQFEPSGENHETYDRLFDLLSRNEFDSARAMLSEKAFDINAYERTFASLVQCFTTLLYRFSGSQYYGSTVKENDDAVEFLLQQGVDPNNLSTVTCEEGSSTDVTDTCNPIIGEMLIKAGSHYALNGLLECAAKARDVAKITELLDRGGDPSLALSVACELHDRALVQKLINAGVNKDDAFYWAVAHEDLELTRIMIEKGLA
jgi:hypothetical protein